MSAALKPKQQGIALLLALTVIAIAASLAATMLFNSELAVSRTTQQLRQTQAWQLALGMEDWAVRLLQRDAELNQVDSYGDLWGQPLPATQVEGGMISGEIQDLSGRFNVNRLLAGDTGQVNIDEHQRFRRLVVDILRLDAAIVDQLLDYMDADREPRPLGYENYPALASGRIHFLAHSDELNRLPAVTERAYETLLPVISVLRPDAPLNLNTASPQVMMMLSPDINQTLARQLQPASARPWLSVTDFLAQPLLADINIPATGLAVHSTGFLAHASIVMDETRLEMYSLILRGGSLPNNGYHVQYRSMGQP